MLQRVAILAVPDLAPFEFGVLWEVFGLDRREHGGPAFDVTIVTAEPGLVPTNAGYSMHIEHDLSAAANADLIAVPARTIGPLDERYLEVIRAAEARGAWLLSMCSGAFVLAQAGVLDGRRSTTHWMYAARLQREHPATTVDPDVLYVDDRRVITGAGTAAGIDACLHLVRHELGAAATAAIARRMIVPPHRDGGQSQYISPVEITTRSDDLSTICEWMLDHLDEELSVDELARRAHLSTRTFARRFRAELGTSPAAWLNRQRLLRAQELLELSDSPIEHIARQCGFGSSAVLRHHFGRSLQTTPQAYRRAFGRQQRA